MGNEIHVVYLENAKVGWFAVLRFGVQSRFRAVLKIRPICTRALPQIPLSLIKNPPSNQEAAHTHRQYVFCSCLFLLLTLPAYRDKLHVNSRVRCNSVFGDQRPTRKGVRASAEMVSRNGKNQPRSDCP